VTLAYGREIVKDQILGLLTAEERTQGTADLLMSDALAAGYGGPPRHTLYGQPGTAGRCYPGRSSPASNYHLD
jgi:hypothetical protein